MGGASCVWKERLDVSWRTGSDWTNRPAFYVRDASLTPQSLKIMRQCCFGVRVNTNPMAQRRTAEETSPRQYVCGKVKHSK